MRGVLKVLFFYSNLFMIFFRSSGEALSQVVLCLFPIPVAYSIAAFLSAFIITFLIPFLFE